MQMRETAEASINNMGGSSQRSTMYSRNDISSEDSHIGPLQMHNTNKGSGLRNYTSDNDSTPDFHDDYSTGDQPRRF